MKHIKHINMNMRRSDSSGIMHDSRQDVRLLMKVCNAQQEKINELVDVVNQLTEDISKGNE